MSTDGLWTPNLEVMSTFDQNLKSVGGYIKWKVKRLYKIYLAKITLSCPMEFDQFPFDSQICQFQMFSHGTKNDSLIIINESKNHIVTSSMSKYNVTIVKLNESELISRRNNSIAGFKIMFQRKTKMYLVSMYLPSTLFVIISWIR